MGLRSDLLRGALLGLVILGIGGRLLMRVIAHMEGRVPAFTIQGSATVMFVGTVAGLLSGLIYHLLRRFVRQPWVRTAAFIAICVLLSLRGVHLLLPLPQVMFMTLALVYLVIVDALGRHSARSLL
jgi:Mg/Co/Ni transporter MgtE